MTSSTPTDAGFPHRGTTPQRHPARWAAPLLTLFTLYGAYAIYVHKPTPTPTPTPTPQLQPPPRVQMEPQLQTAQATTAPTPEKPDPEAVAQLKCAVETAQTRVDESTAQLATLKTRVDSAGDAHHVQQIASQVGHALEQAIRSRQAHQQLLQLLQAAQADPAQLAAADARLLGSQDAVCRLHDARTAAESNTTQQLLTMLPDHPRVQACRAKEREIRQQLLTALATAIRDEQAEQVRLDAACDTLSRESADLQEQVRQLAAIHADYTNQAALLEQQTSALKRAQLAWSRAQADPVAPQDPHPTDLAELQPPAATPPAATPIAAAPPAAQGPGHTLLWAAAIIGGLFVSLGLYTLRSAPTTGTCAPPANAPPVAQVTAHTAQRSAPPTPQKTARMTLRQALERCAEKQAIGDR